ncbi:MAG: hypothetical protein ACR2MO_08650 [Acidimicrobiales bacterium]
MAKKKTIAVVIDRGDLEAFHRDLDLMAKWCRQSLCELAQVDRGRAQWPTITRVMCGVATWHGRLSVALRRADEHGGPPLRLLGSDVASWDRGDDVGLEHLAVEPSARRRDDSPPARTCRRSA